MHLARAGPSWEKGSVLSTDLDAASPHQATTRSTTRAKNRGMPPIGQTDRSLRNAEVEGSIPFRSTRTNSRRILKFGYPFPSKGAASKAEESVTGNAFGPRENCTHAPPPYVEVLPLQAERPGNGRYRRPHTLSRQVRFRRERHHRLIPDFHAGRPTRTGQASPRGSDFGLTINELILAYAGFVVTYYVKDGHPTVEPTNIRLALRLVRRLHGSVQVGSFGPLALKGVRDEMIRVGNCRSEINRRVGRIVRMFKWGVSEQLIPSGVHEALRTVAGLRKSRSQVK